MAIIHSKTVRFGDINMMNDAEEFRWGFRIFERAATRLLKRQEVPPEVPVIPEQFFDKVGDVISSVQLAAHPFIACFSHDHDSLEQWRAYGDDGRGFVIGFSAEKLSQLPVTMFDVLYDEEKQVLEVMALLLELYQDYQLVPSGGDYQGFEEFCAELAIKLTAFKHPGFRSEREVRCVHAIALEKTALGARRFKDEGSKRNGVAFDGQKVGFHARGGHLTAYVDLPTHFDGRSPVEVVITGPKNHSSTGNLLLYLASEGLEDIRFGHSGIPYR